MINELVEAKHQLQLGRALGQWARNDLIALAELGYVPMAETGALNSSFQVIGERAEKAALIVTTNLPFSEWTQVIYNVCPFVQGDDRSDYRSRPYRRNRFRFLSVP